MRYSKASLSLMSHLTWHSASSAHLFTLLTTALTSDDNYAATTIDSSGFFALRNHEAVGAVRDRKMHCWDCSAKF